MTNDPKSVLWRYLDAGHETLLWKLRGLDEYDLRRPLTPTGTNLIGIAKHLAWVEIGYLGDVFGRPCDVGPPPDRAEPNADMYASATESVEDILALFGQARTHAHSTVEALDLDAEGHVPWWGDAGNPVTLHRILVHMIAEIHRHVGQIDILREGLDGATGYREGGENLPDADPDFWVTYCERLERIATETSANG